MDKVEYRYFYHDASDELLKLRSDDPLIEMFRQELETGELEEVPRETFLRIARRVISEKGVD